MFPGIGPVSSLIKILHSDASPAQIASGVCFGLVIGLTPLFNVHNLLLIFLFLILSVNLGALTLSFMLFSILAFAVDPISHMVGLKILKSPGLQPFWTDIYNTPGMMLTRFNNTIVLGSLAISLILCVPVWGASWWFVKGYRGHLRERIEKIWIVKAIKASTLYKWYVRVRDWTG